MCPDTKRTCGGACSASEATHCSSSASKGKQRADSCGDIEDLPQALEDNSSFPAKRKQRAQSSDESDDLPEALREIASSDTSHSGWQTRPRKRAKHIEDIEEPEENEDDFDSGLAFPRLKLGRYCCVPLTFSEPVYFADEEKNWDLSIFADTPNESESSIEEKCNTVGRNPNFSNLGEVKDGVENVSSLIPSEYERDEVKIVDHGIAESENEGSEPILSQGGREEQEVEGPTPSSRSVVEADDKPDTPSQPTPLQEVWLRYRERLTEEYESTGSTLLPAWFLEEVESVTRSRADASVSWLDFLS